MEQERAHSPRQEDYGYDLDRIYASLVGVRTAIPDDAYTADLLGTERSGNGVVIREDGLVLTIGYLVTEAEQVWITDNFGRAVAGHVMGYDQETGFGLIQALGHLDLPALPLGDSDVLNEGDSVVIGGLGGRKGAIAAEVMAIREFAGYWEYLLDKAIFTAPAHPNWGGCGLIGPDGSLLGIGSLMVQQTGEDTAIDGNMVVPINLLKPILEQLSTYGRVEKPSRPWLGLFGTEVQDQVVVAALSANGPADEADIKVGDIGVAVDDEQVKSLAEFFRHVWSLGDAGVTVPLSLARNGEILSTNVRSIARDALLKSPALH